VTVCVCKLICVFTIFVFQRLKHWETRERKKLKEYEREKLKEDEKQEEMVTYLINISIVHSSFESVLSMYVYGQ